MPYIVNPDLSARPLDWNADADLIDALIDAGTPVYGTLAGAVLHGGVQASAFDRPVRKLALYDATAAIALPANAALPAPVGWRADYRIIAHPAVRHA